MGTGTIFGILLIKGNTLYDVFYIINILMLSYLLNYKTDLLFYLMFFKIFIYRDVVKLLLQYEASTNVVDAKGSSPLHLAAWAGDAEIVRLILSQGPSVPKVNLAVSNS